MTPETNAGVTEEPALIRYVQHSTSAFVSRLVIPALRGL